MENPAQAWVMKEWVRLSLRWFQWPWDRCKAVKEPNKSGMWGRCELKVHTEEVDHALDRGMDIPRWSTKWTE